MYIYKDLLLIIIIIIMKLIYPTLLQAANKVNSNSWFNLLEYTNTNYKKKRKIKKFITKYEKTHTINLELTQLQKDKINLWLNDCTDIYNLTNNYIKLNLTNDNKKSFITFAVVGVFLCRAHHLTKWHVGETTCGLYYKSFTIVIYNPNDSTIVIYDRNDNGLYYKSMTIAR